MENVKFVLCMSDSTKRTFFFSSRRRHTRLQGDWSSDVCSSDLIVGKGRGICRVAERSQIAHRVPAEFGVGSDFDDPRRVGQIGRASCRERVEIYMDVVAYDKKENRNKIVSDAK